MRFMPNKQQCLVGLWAKLKNGWVVGPICENSLDGIYVKFGDGLWQLSTPNELPSDHTIMLVGNKKEITKMDEHLETEIRNTMNMNVLNGVLLGSGFQIYTKPENSFGNQVQVENEDGQHMGFYPDVRSVLEELAPNGVGPYSVEELVTLAGRKTQEEL